MENSTIIRRHFAIADFIAAMNGPLCETIVHDLSDLQHSIVHIVNGHLSGRTVGGSITKYALDLIMANEDKTRDAFVNYTGVNEKTGKTLRSSTLFIRNEKGETVGLLCVNLDMTGLISLREELNKIILIPELGSEATPAAPAERFDLSVDEIVGDIISAVLKDTEIHLPGATLSEKKALVSKMIARGVFKFKGAVNQVAELLDISPQTLYRYIKELDV